MIIVDENNEKIKKSEKYKVAPETRLATQNHVKRVMSKRIVYKTCNRLVRICILYHSYNHDTVHYSFWMHIRIPDPNAGPFYIPDIVS